MHVDNPERFQERWNEAVNASVPLDMLMSEDAEDHELAFYPFEMTRDGLFVEVPRGKTIQRRFLSAPFEVCGRCRDPNGNDWGRLLRFKDDDGDEHEHVVTDAALHGDRGVLCSDLAAQGLRLATVASDRSQFVRYLNEVRTHTRVTRLQRTGWHVVKGQPVFVHPTGALGAPTGEIVRFEGGPQSPYAHAGTLEEWQSSVGALIGRHSRLVLLCSAAFAGPLLYLIGHEGGGIHVHGESTTGKTTAVRAAASVWGKGGTPGYVLPWRQTANAFEAILSGRTDTLVAYDEIGVGEAKAISAAMYQITAGTGKARLNRNARLREAMTWRGMLLSTGEVPVGTKIAEERGGRAYAGQQVRVLDLSADVGSGCGIFDADGLDENAGDLADRITSAASQHYGVAGLAFVRQLLVDGPEEVGALVAEMITAFEQAHLPANANGQVRRAARLLGLIGAAGELAAKWDVVPWQEGRSFDAAAKALADWIAQRGGLGAAEVHDGLEQVRTYMAMYGESRFDATDDADARTATTRAGWRRGSGEDRQWLILPSAWRDEICRGRNPQTIARALAERRMLLRDSEGRFQRSERTPLGQHRVYVVTASILEADNDDS